MGISMQFKNNDASAHKNRINLLNKPQQNPVCEVLDRAIRRNRFVDPGVL
jgi:hypothetical protein